MYSLGVGKKTYKKYWGAVKNTTGSNNPGLEKMKLKIYNKNRCTGHEGHHSPWNFTVDYLRTEKEGSRIRFDMDTKEDLYGQRITCTPLA